MKKILQIAAVALALSMVAPIGARAGLIFDNGPVDATRTTWNATGAQNWTIFDDFVIASNTTVTSIEYNIFQNDAADYLNTAVTILDGTGGVLGGIIVPTFSAVASSIVSNGLETSNSNVRFGFTHTITGLSLSLDAGNYFVGFSLFNGSTVLTSIGSGPGSGQTIGAGLFQNTNLHSGDHMAFKIFDGDAPEQVPEPSALALFGLGLLGLGLARRRRKAA